MEKRNSVEVIGDNNNVSIGHLGDIQVNNAPEPQLIMVSNTDAVEADGTHTRVVRLKIVAPYVPGRLQIEANAPDIIGVCAPVRK